jgi:hypothetical protein
MASFFSFKERRDAQKAPPVVVTPQLGEGPMKDNYYKPI